MPVLPHISSECLSKFNFKDKINWPEINHKYIIKEKNEIVIQINGKKRGTILVKKDTLEDELKQQIKETKLLEKYLVDKKIIKTIYIQNKLINYIIN